MKKTYQINFKIPLKLRSDYDLYIEQVLGTSKDLILNDVIETENNGYICGYVDFTLDKENNNKVTEICSYLATLSEGISLSQ